MSTNFRNRLLLPLIFTLYGSCPVVFARGTDVAFRGTVTRIEKTSAQQATLTVRLVGFEIKTKVNAETDIESHGDEMGLAGLTVGDFVKVSGFFSATGIVTKEIQVLDDENDEFRLRGIITLVSPSAGGTTITVLGVAVLVDANTKIERRGPEGSFSVSDLVAGMQIDARGTPQDGKLVATRVKVGNRDDEAVEVRFEGTIKNIQGGRLMVDTEGGGTAPVLTTSSTTVKGTLATGKSIEVKGTLNAQLEVVAETIKVDGEGDEEKNKDGEVEFEKEIRLTPVSPGDLKGTAEIEFEQEDGKVEQEFMVEIDKAQPNTTYRIRVEIASSGTVDFGVLTTDSKGKGKVTFSSKPNGEARDLKGLLPTGKDVRNFVKVQITNPSGAIIFLEGRF